jgi:Zn-dependent peptidase ImmA (M78 family)
MLDSSTLMGPTLAKIAADLALARSEWSLSQLELAHRAKIPVNLLRSIERGRPVETSVISAIAETLGGTSDDVLAGRQFWSAPSIALKASALPDSSIVRAALARVSVAARLVAGLNILLDRPDLWLSRGSKLGPTGPFGAPTEQAEKLAKVVRKELGNKQDPLLSVRANVARLGIPTFLSEFASDEIDGAMWQARGESPCIVVNVLARGGLVTAMRMTVAHELCHALFDRPKRGGWGLVEARSENTTRLEKRANAFAAYFLAPRSGVARFLKEAGSPGKPSAQHLLGLCRHFGMGAEAMARHLQNCGYWAEEDFLANRGAMSPEFSCDDDRESRPLNGEDRAPLEKRGLVLDLATQALERGKINPGRWREIMTLNRWDNWRLLLDARHVALPSEQEFVGGQ